MSNYTVYADYYYLARCFGDEEANEVEIINLGEVIKSNFCDDGSTCAVKTKRKLDFDSGKIQMCYEGEDGLYEMQFLRLREADQPLIARDTGEIENLRLDDGTYFSESASCLFDPQYNLMVLQRNWHGARAGFVEKFLNALLGNLYPGSYFSLRAITGNGEYSKIIGKRIRSIDCSVYNICQAGGISDVFAPFTALKPTTLSFRVKASRRAMENDASHAMIDELRNAPDIRKLRVEYLDGDNTARMADLLEDRMRDSFQLNNISKLNPVSHSEVYAHIKAEYTRRNKTADGFRSVEGARDES